MPLLSIIIISYNTKQITLDCLESIFKQTDPKKLDFEIIVVDNNSQDGSAEVIRNLKKTYNNITLIENKENKGFGRANNQGVKHAKGEYILLLNSDTIILDHAVEKMLNFYLKNQTKIHFLGPKLLNKDLSPQPSAAPFYTLPVVFAALFLKGDHYGLTRYSPDKLRTVDWISGACILTKKTIYEKINGFDEDIFMYMEEVDLLYRAKKAGFSTYFYPEARIIHLGSASSQQKTFPILQVYRGFLFFYHKHYSKLSLYILKSMLQLKAWISVVLGTLTGSNYLKTTYEQARELVKMDR